MTESLYPRDLIERLRLVLDECEAEIRIKSLPGTTVRYFPDQLERLRTIQAHRKWLDLHVPHTAFDWLCVHDNSFVPCEFVRDLASIYFPESGATDG